MQKRKLTPPAQKSAMLARARGELVESQSPAAGATPVAPGHPPEDRVQSPPASPSASADPPPAKAGGPTVSPETPVHEMFTEPDALLTPEAWGKLARAWMDNPVTKEAYRLAVSEAARAWENSKPEERDLREQAYYTVRALRRIEYHVGRIAQASKISDLQAERIKAFAR
jgi:hypothetical protein